MARTFKTSRNTVKKALRRYKTKGEEGLGDLKRRPKNFYRKTPDELEKKVVSLRKRTNYGSRRLSILLEREESIYLAPSTIGSILRRRGLNRPKRKRSFVMKRSNFYDWESIYPLQQFQIDLKDILDLKTLSFPVYEHLLSSDLPRYQWTAIDVKTRLRFIAYSYEKTFANGLAFMILLALWLRAFGIDHPLFFQTDWGEEFGGKSERKYRMIRKTFFTPLGVELIRIPKGKKEYNGYVERSHRTDDEEFYNPKGLELGDEESFLVKSFQWLYYYNRKRAHLGKGMKKRTPFVVLKTLYPWISDKILLFQPFILDNLSTNDTWKGGQYVSGHYRVVRTFPKNFRG